MLRAIFLCSGLLLVSLSPANAQELLLRRSRQSVAVGYYLVDFRFAGNDSDTSTRFDFSGPAYGLVYMRPSMMVTAAYGRQEASADQESLALLDGSLTTWRPLLLVTRTATTRLYVPILISGAYRRITFRDNEDAVVFNATTLSLGTGAGLDQALHKKVFVTVRVTPMIGILSSTLADGISWTYQIDGDLHFHVAELYGRLGLDIAYGIRYKMWNINGSSGLFDGFDELFDYRGWDQVVRVGISF